MYAKSMIYFWYIEIFHLPNYHFATIWDIRCFSWMRSYISGSFVLLDSHKKESFRIVLGRELFATYFCSFYVNYSRECFELKIQSKGIPFTWKWAHCWHSFALCFCKVKLNSCIFVNLFFAVSWLVFSLTDQINPIKFFIWYKSY